MRVLITGAAGFIGRHVIRALLERGSLCNTAGERQPIAELVLFDRVPAGEDTDSRVRIEIGDFCNPDRMGQVIGDGFDSIFHLAASLTIEAETEFEKGMEVNLHAMMRLLEACRKQGRRARFVYPSSLAVFGGPLPATVDDTVAHTPQTSYGTHKAVNELLINDYSRHGFIDGRVLRLPIVLIRPGTPSPAVSDKVAGIVREPLLGQDVVCPLKPETRFPVCSARRVAEALVSLHDLAEDGFDHTRAMNLPSLTVSIAEMVASLDRFAGSRALGKVSWEPDPALQTVVESWPVEFVSQRATAAGIAADASFNEVVDAFVLDYLTDEAMS